LREDGGRERKATRGGRVRSFDRRFFDAERRNLKNFLTATAELKPGGSGIRSPLTTRDPASVACDLLEPPVGASTRNGREEEGEDIVGEQAIERREGKKRMKKNSSLSIPLHSQLSTSSML